jgi:hypothetical protein
MSGMPLPWWIIAGAFTATSGIAWLLAGKERGIGTVTGAAVVVQAALHTGFSLAQTGAAPSPDGHTSFARQWATLLLCGQTGTSLTGNRAVHPVAKAGLNSQLHQPHPAMPAMPGMAGSMHPGPGHIAVDMPQGADGMGHAMTGMPHAFAGMSPTGMLASHLVVALLSGLWMAYGERAVFRIGPALAGWLTAPLRALFHRLPTPVAPPPRAQCGHDVAGPRRLLLVHVITSRGPPHGIAVTA